MKKTILFLLMFCSAMQINSAPLFLQSNKASYDLETSVKLPFDTNVSQGSMLICAVRGFISSEITVSSNSDWFLYDSMQLDYYCVRIFVSVSKSTTPDTVAITSATPGRIGDVIIAEYSDAMATTLSLKNRLDTTAVGTDGVVMGNLSGLTNDLLCSFLYSFNSGVAYTAGTDFTMINYVSSSYPLYFENYLFNDNISKNITYTATGANNKFCGVSFVLSPKKISVDSLVFTIDTSKGTIQYDKVLDSDNDRLINNSIVSTKPSYTFLRWESRHGKVLIKNLSDKNAKFYLFGNDTIDPVFIFSPKHSGWPLEVLSWDIDKAYPGIEYNFRLGVRGGEYPYTFTLQHGPTGMTINKTTGEILWTPESATLDSVRVKITDNKGDSLIHKYNIEATTSGFYFVDSATGSNSNDGSKTQPWLTMAYASATADSTSYVYVKAGTYNESFSINHNNCGRFIAYPGDTVTVIGSTVGTGSIWINGGDKRIFQGFTFNGNGRRWLFSVGSEGYSKHIIWRKNIMHNVGSTDGENPAFIFFWGDNSGNPILGLGGHRYMVIQDNLFYDLRDTVIYHGASVTCYDVQDLLYEDNKAHDIDGRGFNNKDMGYMNTIRNNVFYNCNDGIDLMCQEGESRTEVNYNHIYNCGTAICVGIQLAYIKNIFIHHNTLIGNVQFGGVLADTASYNINFYKNILGNGNNRVYNISIWNDTILGHFPYKYADYFTNPDFKKVLIDSNIVWSDVSDIVGPGWGISNVSWTNWRRWGHDNNSLFMQLQLDSDSIPVLPDSLKIYGAFLPTRTPATITIQPQSDTVKSGETATFSVTATGSGLTYQWYGNNTLIPSATSSTYSFTAAKIYNGTRIWCLLTTDTTISTDTAVLIVTDMTVDQTMDSLILNIPSDPLFTGQQWYEHDTAITGATALRFVVEADSAAYAKKNYYYCKLWNTVNDTVQSGTWQLGLQPSGTKQKRWFGFKAGAFIGAWR